MGLFGCFKPPPAEEATVCENQTFSSNAQASSSLTTAGNGQAYSENASVNAYPPPTEHQLPWSHAAHPPSVASSLLLDPEGQAFAKHYNPLLSQETSQESVDSINHRQAVIARRLDEHAQTSLANEQQLSTAATMHARQVADTAGNTQLEQSAQPQYVAIDNAAHHDLADQVQENTAADDNASNDVHTSADKRPAQHKLGSQITLALQRHGKSSQASQPASNAATQPLPAAGAMQILARVLPDPTEASVNLFPQGSIQAAATPASHTHDARTGVVPQNVALPGSKVPCQPLPVKEQEVQCSPPSAAAMLQNMATRAASYRAGISCANVPSSPVPSIDCFSSMSSWGASTIPSIAVSRAIDSILTVASDSTDSAAQAALPSDQHPDRMKEIELSRQQTQAKGVPMRHKSKLPVQDSKPGIGSIRAMHDSSSSWSNRSNVVKSADLDSPARIASKASVGKTQSVKTASTKRSPARADVHDDFIVEAAETQEQALSNKDMPAGPAEQGTQLPPPHASHRTGLQVERRKANLQENLPPDADYVGSHAGQAPQAHAVPGRKPQQTWEEMTAWLDAQLAKASGSKPVAASTTAAPAANALAASSSKPKGLPVPPHQVSSALKGAAGAVAPKPGLSSKGGTALRHADASGGQSKMQELSVSEMMRWLDNKLAQAALTQQPAKQICTLRSNASGSMPPVSEQPALKPIPTAADSATPSSPETAAEDHPDAAPLHQDCTSTEAQFKAAEDRLRQESATAAHSVPATPNAGPATQEAARLSHAVLGAQPCSSLKQPSHHAVPHQLHVRNQGTALQTLQLADTQQHVTGAACMDSIQPQTAEPVDAQQSMPDAKANNGADQQLHATSEGLQADRNRASTALPTPHSSSQRQRPVMSTAAPQQQTLTKAVSVSAPQAGCVRVQQTASIRASQRASVNTQQASSVSAPKTASVSAPQTASVSAQQTASVSAQQTAAEMLQWLDATLAAKKPAALKQAAQTVPKQSASAGQSRNMPPLQNAAPSDMLAWLDAKLATAKKTAELG